MTADRQPDLQPARVAPAPPATNSRDFWDQQFATDWQAKGGCDRSRVFMELLVRFLPATLYEHIAAAGLSLLDCGSALGDGTAMLADEFPRSAVSGVDFSSEAVAVAQRRFPHLRFAVDDVQALRAGADVVIASHCLEHLERPLSALSVLLRNARHHVLVLVPFLEQFPPLPAHLRIVHPTTFPLTLDGWTVTDHIVLPPTPQWSGLQLLLIYGRQRDGHDVVLPPLPAVLDPELSIRLAFLEARLGDVPSSVTAAVTAALEPFAAALRCAAAATAAAADGATLRSLAADTAALRSVAAGTAARVEALGGARKSDPAAADAGRDERVRRIVALEDEVRRGHLYVEQLRRNREELARGLAALEAETERLRAEVAVRRADAEGALAELAGVHGSRLWRLGNLYWSLRRRLTGRPRRDGGGAPRTGQPALPADAPALVDASAVPAAASELIAPSSALQPLPRGRQDILVFSIIDWDFRFQRPQQIALQYARHGHRVFYLSTTRFGAFDDPAWQLEGKAPGVAELVLRSRRPLAIYEGVLAAEDLHVLAEALGQLLEDHALGDTVCLVQLPFWAPLAERLRERFGWRVVYDCMDEWANFPGIGPDVVALEDGLVRSADLTVVSAARLYARLETRARRLLLARNAVDLDHYERLYGPGVDLGELRHPVIGYFGALASWVDAVLLEKIARELPHCTLVLAGGVSDVDLTAVAALPNVRLLGQRPYAEMPQLLWHFDVCVIPFLLNEITQATNPVKFYEYLTSGKPVVAPAMEELLPFADVCYLADGHDGFVAAIKRALAEPESAPCRATRRAIARDNDWSERYEAIQAALTDTYPLVSVVMVCHGGERLTRECLTSVLEDETWPRLEVLVVDNASPDGTAAYLRSVDDPRLRLFLQDRNLGFPAANNLALREATGEVVLFLNNDTVVPPGLVGRLVRATMAPDVGLACATTNFCGNEARIEPQYEAIADMPGFAARRARAYARVDFDIAVAALYCAAARRDVIEQVGPLDEAFGVGMFEDDDYSLRVRAAGYRVVCVEDAYVHHFGQGSFRALSKSQYADLWARNQAWFEKKWGRPWMPHSLRAGVAPPRSRVGVSIASGKEDAT